MVNATEAKRLAKEALASAGLTYDKLTAKTVDGYVFVKPIGLELPDPKITQVRQALKGTGAILDTPRVVWEGYTVK